MPTYTVELRAPYLYPQVGPVSEDTSTGGQVPPYLETYFHRGKFSEVRDQLSPDTVDWTMVEADNMRHARLVAQPWVEEASRTWWAAYLQSPWVHDDHLYMRGIT